MGRGRTSEQEGTEVTDRIELGGPGQLPEGNWDAGTAESSP